MALRPATPRRKAKRPEQALHIAVEQFLRLAWPADLPYSHFPSGEQRDIRVAAKLKAMGLKPGWPDFIFLLPNGQAGFIELKAAYGRMSDGQDEFRDRVLALRCGHAICRSVEEVEATLKRWLAKFGRHLTARIQGGSFTKTGEAA